MCRSSASSNPMSLPALPCVRLMQITRGSFSDSFFRAVRFNSTRERSTMSTFPKLSGSASISFRSASYSAIICARFSLSLIVLAILLIRASSLLKRCPPGLVSIRPHRFCTVLSLFPVKVLPREDPTQL